MPPKPGKTTDTFTPEEQKQFDSMREADNVSPPPEPKQPDPEPPKVETPAAEVKEAKETRETKEPRENTMVPHAALEKERIRRKEAEREKEELRIQQAKLEERLNLINQAMEASQKKEPAKPQKLEVPDPEKDALGALKAVTHNTRLTEEENRLLKQAIEKREADDKAREDRQRQAESEATRVKAELSRASSEEAEFAARTPDFQDAAGYLRSLRRQQLQLMGFSDQPQYDPQTFQMTRPPIEYMIGQDLLQMARNAESLKQNAGEFLYNMAKASGYQGKATTSNQTGQTQPATAAPSVAEQIDKLNAAQRANRSLSDVSGNAPAGKLDGKDLAAMSEKEFAKLLKSMSQQEQHEYFGN